MKTPKPDPLKPPIGLLVKLGSIVVHVDEMLSPDGHEFDRGAVEIGMADSELKAWIAAMTKLAMLPVKRRKEQGK